jgi:Nuclease-related domain
MSVRRAGQHAREVTRRKARFLLVAMAVLITTAVAVVFLGDLAWSGVVAVELALIAVLLQIERFAAPVVERWDRGAAGEEHVGRVLESLEADGWLTLHDVDTGRGNIDTIVVGPGGLFTIEVKSHRGRVCPDRLNPAWLSQAYAQRKWLEGVAGRRVIPMLVFSRAFLVGTPVTRQRGVTVLPARMLVGHLRRQPTLLSAAEVEHLQGRLAGSFSARTSLTAEPH